MRVTGFKIDLYYQTWVNAILMIFKLQNDFEVNFGWTVQLHHILRQNVLYGIHAPGVKSV